MKNNLIAFLIIFFCIPIVNSNNAQCVRTNGPASGIVFCFTQKGSSVYAGTKGGIYITNDNGKYWKLLSKDLVDLPVYSMARDSNYFFAGTLGYIYRSSDNGKSWTALNIGLNKTARVISLLVSGEKLLAGTNGTLFISYNKGITWKLCNEGRIGRLINSLLEVNSTIYAGTLEGIFSSNTETLIWNDSNKGIKVKNNNISSMIAKNGVIFAGADASPDRALYRSDDKGISWKEINRYIPNAVLCLACNGETLFAGTYNKGIYYSTNNGATWQSPQVNTEDIHVLSLFVSKNIIYAGTEGGGVFISNDDGRSWTQSNSGMNVSYVNSLTSLKNKTYASLWGGGVYITSNNGKSWKSINNGLTTHYVNVVAMHLDKIYCGSFTKGVFVLNKNKWVPDNKGLKSTLIYSLVSHGDDLYAGTEGGIYVKNTTDKEWKLIANLTISNPNTLFIRDSVLLVGSCQWIFKITKKEDNWSKPEKLLSLKSDLVKSTAIIDSILIAGTDKWIYVSNDGGSNWKIINSSFPQKVSINSLFVYRNNIFACTENDGLYISSDNGYNWRRVEAGLLSSKISSLFVKNQNLYVGTMNSGVWYLPLKSY